KRGLRRRVGGKHRPRRGRSPAGNVDDPTAAFRLHARDNRTAQRNRYEEIQADGLFEFAPRHLPGCSDWSLNGGVVDEKSDRAWPLGGLAYTLRSLRIAEVAAECRHASPLAFRRYPASDLRERCLIARHEQQIGATRGELVSTEPAQTAARSCD